MVQDLAGVVEDGAGGGLGYNLLQGEAFETAPGKKFVQIVNIPLQVLTVMETKGFITNHRREGLVWEFYQCKHTASSSPASAGSSSAGGRTRGRSRGPWGR